MQAHKTATATAGERPEQAESSRERQTRGQKERTDGQTERERKGAGKEESKKVKREWCDRLFWSVCERACVLSPFLKQIFFFFSCMSARAHCLSSSVRLSVRFRASVPVSYRRYLSSYGFPFRFLNNTHI